jgi:hypothetical protein
VTNGEQVKSTGASFLFSAAGSGSRARLWSQNPQRKCRAMQYPHFGSIIGLCSSSLTLVDRQYKVVISVF